MNPQKQSHVNRIRINSAYSTFRGVVHVCSVLLYLIAAVVALISFSFFARAWFIGLPGFLVAGFIALLAKAGQEAALMLADLADSTLEFHAWRSSERAMSPSIPQKT